MPTKHTNEATFGHSQVAPHTIDKEEEEKLVQRLYYRQMELSEQRAEERAATLRRSRPAGPARTLTNEEEEKLVHRVYNEQIDQFAATREERQRETDAEDRKRDVKFDSGVIDDQVRRMYEDEMAKSKARREELDTRFHPAPETKKVPKAQMQEAVNRLYNVDYEKRDEELFKKYVYPNDPKCSRITPDEVSAMADRLSTTKGSA